LKRLRGHTSSCTPPPCRGWCCFTASSIRFTTATDDEALDAFLLTARTEGIIPALETSHAIAHALKLAATMPGETRIVVNLSGRGDKDVEEAGRLLAMRS
jgi:tryptophan synthase beta subunit